MSAVVVLQWYLGLQVAVAVAAGAVHLLARLGGDPRVALWAARALVPAAVVLPALLVALPGEGPVRPPVQVYSVPEDPGAVEVALSASPAAASSPAVVRPGGRLRAGALAVAGVLGAFLVARAVLAGLALARSLRSSVCWRRLGRVELRVGWEAASPYALWLPGRRVVVLDEATFADERDRRVAVLHELQHHRQGDTAYAWALAALRALCLPNPLAGVLARRLAELEELAVDAALIGRRSVTPPEYGRMLLRAARRAVRPTPLPCTAGMAPAASLLKRRVEMLHRRTLPRFPLIAVAVAAAALLTSTAWTAERLVQDRRVAEEVVAEAAGRAATEVFPIPANDVVLECVERYAGTAWGRAFLADGLARMADHEPLVLGALDRYGLPHELAAVPLVESGYRNLGEVGGESDAPGMMGAGIWMFIPTTARRYGLRVSPRQDDRLDEVLETDAAMRLLSDLYDEFGDWHLALAGYNQGARHVREAIEAEGTDDVWALIERGALNRYAGYVTAAVIVMEDPSLADAER